MSNADDGPEREKTAGIEIEGFMPIRTGRNDSKQ
jgi:hypothetical protein